MNFRENIPKSKPDAVTVKQDKTESQTKWLWPQGDSAPSFLSWTWGKKKKGTGCRNTNTRWPISEKALSQPDFPWLGYHVWQCLHWFAAGPCTGRAASQVTPEPSRAALSEENHGLQPRREALSPANDAVLSPASNAAWDGWHRCVCSRRSLGNYTWIQSNYAEPCTLF